MSLFFNLGETLRMFKRSVLPSKLKCINEEYV